MLGDIGVESNRGSVVEVAVIIATHMQSFLVMNLNQDEIRTGSGRNQDEIRMKSGRDQDEKRPRFHYHLSHFSSLIKKARFSKP